MSLSSQSIAPILKAAVTSSPSALSAATPASALSTATSSSAPSGRTSSSKLPASQISAATDSATSIAITQPTSTTFSSSATSKTLGATFSTTTASTKPVSTQHLSPGGIAGIAIGCALVASIFTVAFMMFLRQKKSKTRSRRSRSKSSRLQRPNGTEDDAKRPLEPLALTQPKFSIEAFLPQGTDDATIRKKVLMFFDQVELHVDNFYVHDAVELTPEQEGALSKFGTPVLTKPLAALLETSKRKSTIIKHCLAYYVVSLVSPSHRSRTLLPYELSAMLAATKGDDGRQSGDQNFGLALSRWRMLTAYLRPDLFDRMKSSSPEEQTRLHDCAAGFSMAFAPFSEPQNDEPKLQHLVEVLRSAVNTALWLLAQPSFFEFDWSSTPDVGDRSPRAVVTVPSLWKTHDENGSRLDQALLILAGVTVLP